MIYRPFSGRAAKESSHVCFRVYEPGPDSGFLCASHGNAPEWFFVLVRPYHLNSDSGHSLPGQNGSIGRAIW